MSQENVEVLRELWGAYARGDFDHVLTLCDPHIVSITLEEGAIYGADAVRENYERWREAWEQPEITVEEMIGVRDHVFVAAHFRARGRGSGVEVDSRWYEVYAMRNRKVLRVDEFRNRDEALEVAGLRD